jgi:hypothetical protein
VAEVWIQNDHLTDMYALKYVSFFNRGVFGTGFKDWAVVY